MQHSIVLIFSVLFSLGSQLSLAEDRQTSGPAKTDTFETEQSHFLGFSSQPKMEGANPGPVQRTAGLCNTIMIIHDGVQLFYADPTDPDCIALNY